MLKHALLLVLVFSSPMLRSAPIDDLQVLYTPNAEEVVFTLDDENVSRVVSVEAITDGARYVGGFYRWDGALVFRVEKIGSWILGNIRPELSPERSFHDPVVGAIRQRSSKIVWEGEKPGLEEIRPGVFELNLKSRTMSSLKTCVFTLSKPPSFP